MVAASRCFACAHRRRHRHHDVSGDDAATLGHTGRPLVAGAGTTTIYGLVTVAALCRLLAPFAGAQYIPALTVAGFAWSAAFGLFVMLYLRPLALPRVPRGVEARPI